MLGTTDMTEISTACFRKLKEGSALEHLVHFNVILKVLAQSPLPRYVQVPFFLKKTSVYLLVRELHWQRLDALMLL